MTAIPERATAAIRASVAPRTRLDDDPTITVAPDDPAPNGARLEVLGPGHAVLVEPGGASVDEPGQPTVEGPPARTRILFGAARRDLAAGTIVQEVVIDGWRIEIVLESDRRAALRERATRDRGGAAGSSGPTEVRAIIPGRIVAVSVVPGDVVTAGQQVLVLEAMKMQNELRAPRAGGVERVAVAVGENVEVGDLLMVIT
jgi:biotin carboxyl carrier protein